MIPPDTAPSTNDKEGTGDRNLGMPVQRMSRLRPELLSALSLVLSGLQCAMLLYRRSHLPKGELYVWCFSLLACVTGTCIALSAAAYRKDGLAGRPGTGRRLFVTAIAFFLWAPSLFFYFQRFEETWSGDPLLNPGTVLFHGMLLVCDAWLVRWILRDPLFRRISRGAGLWILAAILGSKIFGGHFFHSAGLITQALFIHGSGMLATLAILFHGRIAKGIRLGSGVAALTLIGVGTYVHWIEPYQLEVSHHRVESVRALRPLRIAVLSDLQIEDIGQYEQDVLHRLKKEQPDLILLTGDYVQVPEPRRSELIIELNSLFRRLPLTAPLGIYAVPGDCEWEGWERIFEGTGVRVFSTSGTFEAGELRITGLSLEDSRDLGLSLPGSDRFHIVFGHAPDFALAGLDADLLVAGHTHGGQVRIPFFGPPLTLTAVPRSWTSGLTQIRDDQALIVSRGIGMERGLAPRVRFLCPPELVIIEVMPSVRLRPAGIGLHR